MILGSDYKMGPPKFDYLGSWPRNFVECLCEFFFFFFLLCCEVSLNELIHIQNESSIHITFKLIIIRSSINHNESKALSSNTAAFSKLELETWLRYEIPQSSHLHVSVVL